MLDLNQPGQAMDQNTSFAATGTGEHQGVL